MNKIYYILIDKLFMKHLDKNKKIIDELFVNVVNNDMSLPNIVTRPTNCS
jgi:hypothetical protein